MARLGLGQALSARGKRGNPPSPGARCALGWGVEGAGKDRHAQPCGLDRSGVGGSPCHRTDRRRCPCRQGLHGRQLPRRGQGKGRGRCQGEGARRGPASRLPLASETPHPRHRLQSHGALEGGQCRRSCRRRRRALGAKFEHDLHREPRLLLRGGRRARSPAPRERPLYRHAGAASDPRAGYARSGHGDERRHGRSRRDQAGSRSLERGLEGARSCEHAHAPSARGAPLNRPYRRDRRPPCRRRQRGPHPRRRVQDALRHRGRRRGGQAGGAPQRHDRRPRCRRTPGLETQLSSCRRRCRLCHGARFGGDARCPRGPVEGREIRGMGRRRCPCRAGKRNSDRGRVHEPRRVERDAPPHSRDRWRRRFEDRRRLRAGRRDEPALSGRRRILADALARQGLSLRNGGAAWVLRANF